MRVSTARDEVVAHTLEFFLKGFGVGDDLLLVELIFGREGLLEGNGEGGDRMIVGAALVTREDAMGNNY